MAYHYSILEGEQNLAFALELRRKTHFFKQGQGCYVVEHVGEEKRPLKNGFRLHAPETLAFSQSFFQSTVPLHQIHVPLCHMDLFLMASQPFTMLLITDILQLLNSCYAQRQQPRLRSLCGFLRWALSIVDYIFSSPQGQRPS